MKNDHEGWRRLRKALGKYLEHDCVIEGERFERELAPLLGQTMRPVYPPVGLDGYWFVLEGVRILAPTDISGSVRRAELIGTGPTGPAVLSLRKGMPCWVSSCATLRIATEPRTLYRAFSPKLVAQLVAEELNDEEE